MSGIFGIFNISENNRDIGHDLILLKSWHESYGKDCVDTIIEDSMGMGYCVNHFSDKFPAPASILKYNNIYAVMDALLYNRDELISKLYGDSFEIVVEKQRSISDEQLLFETYLKYGNDGLVDVNGDFAGAIYFGDKKEIVLLTSHLGVRPLFYYFNDGLFVFATDKRSILSLQSIDKTIDEEIFYRGIRRIWVNENERTFFKYIKALKPAHVLNFSSDDLYLTQYWKLGKTKIRFSTDEEYIKKMRELVEDAVNRRLDVYDGVVGGELSGGLDSSVIDILINRKGRKGYYYSWSPSLEEHPLQENDERINIEAICSNEEIECKYTDGLPSFDTFESYVPCDAHTTQIETGMQFFSKNDAKIIFSGWGGDEGVSHRADKFELWYQKEYISYIKEALYGLEYEKNNVKKFFRIIRTIASKMKHYKLGVFSLRKNKKSIVSDVVDISKKEFAKSVEPRLELPSNKFGISPIKQIESGGNRKRCEDVIWQGANQGVQYVFPFLDYRVEDFAVSIPRRMYQYKGKKRYIYFKAFDDILPSVMKSYTNKNDPGKLSFFISGIVKESTMQTKRLKNEIDIDRWKYYIDFKKIDEILKKSDSEEYRWNEYLAIAKILELCLRIEKLCSIENKTPKDLNI